MKKILSIVFLCCIYASTYAQPANDEPCGAITLTPVIATSLPTCTPTIPLTWTAATNSTTTPLPSCGNLGTTKKDIWYKITVPIDVDSILINTAVGTGSFPSGDVVMALYSATACSGTFTQISCNDDSGNPSPNAAMPFIKTAIPTAGIYYLRIFDYEATIANGDMKICINLKLNQPPIDPNKRVGINTNIPEYNLDVNGTGKFRSNVILDSLTTARDLTITNNLKITNGAPAANKVLTSDAAGNATWQTLSPASATAWGLTGNTGTNAVNNFIGNTDNVPLIFRVDNKNFGKISYGNIAFGEEALQATSVGTDNVAIGTKALLNNLTGSDNVAIGLDALKAHQFNNYNTAVGSGALSFNINGNTNTALGGSALNRNTSGNGNSSIGFRSLYQNVANENTAMGNYAATNNTTGKNIIALGNHALASNTVTNDLIAIGDSALYNNGSAGGIEGELNIAIGKNALFTNTNGESNIAIGNNALKNNNLGDANTAIGESALLNSNSTGNIAIGFESQKKQLTGGVNVAIGVLTLQQNITGEANTALGAGALKNNLVSNNVAIGHNSMDANTTGANNNAIGRYSLYKNTNGHRNVAIGDSVMYNNTTGFYNAALGYSALAKNTTGNYNVALGSVALFNNSTGIGSVAIGAGALYSNTTGFNSAIGYNALLLNTTGEKNTAIGANSLKSNISGFDNTAIGDSSLTSNTIGKWNVAVGVNALRNNVNGFSNVVIGTGSFRNSTIGNGNTIVGAFNNPAGSLDNYSALGSNVTTAASSSSMVEIGNTTVSVIRGQVGFTTYSDKRIKQNIQQDVPGLSFINKLLPVTYYIDVHKQNDLMKVNSTPDYKGKYDIEKIRMTGFLAQDVEQAAKDCKFDFSGVVKPQNENDLYSLRYSEFVVPLVKAVQEQQTQIELLKQQNELLIKRLEALEKK